jgi:hypothetical protein
MAETDEEKIGRALDGFLSMASDAQREEITKAATDGRSYKEFVRFSNEQLNLPDQQLHPANEGCPKKWKYCASDGSCVPPGSVCP